MKAMLSLLSSVVASAFVLVAPVATAAAPAASLVRGNVVEVVAANPKLKTLVTAVKAADLVNTLATTQNITLFAPTDAAFAALPAGALDKLLADKTALTNVLEYHVIAQRVPAAEAIVLDQATMLNGEDVSLQFDGRHLYVNNAKVIETDIQASNGIIHVIDAVLLP